MEIERPRGPKTTLLVRGIIRSYQNRKYQSHEVSANMKHGTLDFFLLDGNVEELTREIDGKHVKKLAYRTIVTE